MGFLVRVTIVLATLGAVGGCAVLLKSQLDFNVGYFPSSAERELGAPSWSPDGSELVFHIESERKSEIYRVDADGGDLEQLTSEEAYSRSPAWSPDGSRIAFSRAPDHLTYALYVAERDGSHARRIFSSDVSIDGPCWSPDGARVPFVTGLVDQMFGSVGHWVTLRADGRGLKQLDPWDARDPAWSPDGRWIAYWRSKNEADGVYGVYVVPAEGGRERLVVKQVSDPAWSPDGKRLAVSGRAGIFVVPLKGGRPRRLPIRLPDEYGPDDLAWSPDGRRIAFVTYGALYVANVDGSGVRRVASVKDA